MITISSFEEIGTVVRDARKAKGWSQGQLGKAAEVSITTVHQIENGEPTKMTVLKALFDAMDYKISFAVAIPNTELSRLLEVQNGQA